eukprot:CAMPEP_0197033886 /NCGR_PEP_ID=MMETSP1384-20130603/12168_1 /TAXON_ID=29189 /ORGANISM="Ammonia sp." /LENGTH=304 /DNA_ID=CAMNT_0042463749 /DNA_START=102 /DNA_END=1019 /DNA_ORIENTATION=-
MAQATECRDVYICNKLDIPIAVTVQADKRYIISTHMDSLSKSYHEFRKKKSGNGALTANIAEILKVTASGSGSVETHSIDEQTKQLMIDVQYEWNKVASNGFIIIDPQQNQRFSVENVKEINYISVMDMHGNIIASNYNTAHSKFEVVKGEYVPRIQDIIEKKVAKTKIVNTRPYGVGKSHPRGWQVDNIQSKITGLRMRVGGMVDAMEVHVDGKARRGWGGNGGVLLPPFILADDEVITTVEGRFGNEIKYLRFITNKGREYSGGGLEGTYASFHHKGIELKDIKITNGNIIEEIQFKFLVPE